MRQDGGQAIIAEGFLNNPLGYVDAFDMAGFTPFPQIKFRKAALDGFPRQQFPSDFRNVPQGVGLEPLNRFLPDNPSHGSPESGIQIVRVYNLGKIIVWLERRLPFRFTPGFTALIPRLPPLAAGHLYQSLFEKQKKPCTAYAQGLSLLRALRDMPRNVTGHESA
jgi:hypothetical protein